MKYILLLLVLFISGCWTEVWICNDCDARYNVRGPHLPKANFVQCPSCGEERLKYSYTKD